MARIKFISLDALLEKQANKEQFKLVEVLDEEHFREGHLPGAINIPTVQLIEQAPQQLKKTDEIIVYCAHYACPASTNASQTLLKLGYKKVWDFKGGKKLWEQAGLAMVK